MDCQSTKKITGDGYMGRLEKLIISMLLIGAVGFVSCSYMLIKSINEAGGLRQVIVDTGKEVKSIAKEINED